MQCTLEAIGFHFKLKVIFLHDSERYGYLIEDGQETPLGEVARRTWEPLDRCQTLLDELLRKGVLGRSKDGHLYDHELVNQQEQRDATSNRVRRHRRRKSVTPVKRNSNGDVTPIEDDMKLKMTWFEDVWSKYPNKDGRKEALKAFLKSVQTERGLDRIQAALTNYLGSDRVQKGYIKNGSTWFNNWTDWVDFKRTETVDITRDRQAEIKAERRAAGRCENDNGIFEDFDGLKRCAGCGLTK